MGRVRESAFALAMVGGLAYMATIAGITVYYECARSSVQTHQPACDHLEQPRGHPSGPRRLQDLLNVPLPSKASGSPLRAMEDNRGS